MHLIRRAGLLAVIASVSALAGWGCNGNGESLTLEEYFDRLEAADEEFNERSDALFANEPEDIESAREALSELPELIGDFVDELEEIEPPDEVEDAHEQAVDAGREVQSEFERLLDDVGDVETLEDLFEALEGEDVDAIVQRFDDACLELLQVAEDNDIDVTLNCGD